MSPTWPPTARHGRPRRFTFTEGRNIPSGWTRDNDAIVFVSDFRGRPVLVRQRLNEDAATLIADEPGIAGAARLTPDGNDVVYLTLVRQRLASARTMRLMIVPLEGGASRELVSGRFVDGGARCTMAPANLCAFAERSADERQLIFTSLDVRNGRGRELAHVDVDPGGDYRWSLSPDGTRIAVLNALDRAIRIVSLAGGPAHEFRVEGAKALGYVSWTSDGQRLIVPSVDSRMATLLSVDMRGAATVVWQQPGAVDISGIPSLDGRRVAIWVRSRHANLWLAENPRGR